MRKSIIVFLIVGAFFAGTLVVPDFASADPEQQVQLDALINIVGILFDGINSGFDAVAIGFDTVATQIGDVQTDVDANADDIANQQAAFHHNPITDDICIGTSPLCP